MPATQLCVYKSPKKRASNCCATSKTKVLLILSLLLCVGTRRTKKKVFLFSFLSVHPHTCGKWVFNNLRERIMPEQIIFPWLFSNKRLKRRTCVRAFVLNTEKVASKCLMRLDFSLFIAGYFWHITDLHFDSSYSTRGDIVRSRF